MPLNLATTFTELTANDPIEAQGAIGSLAGNLQAAGGCAAAPGLSAAGPASSMVSAIGAAQQAQPVGAAPLAGLAKELQQEAGRAELAQQHLAAQLEAAGHLGALAGAAQGSGLRVQVVGGQRAQW
jgi:hypothetical protein